MEFFRSNPSVSRPDELIVTYTINGKDTIRRFKNEADGGIKL